ncbi:MAG: putative lipid II flippase FtsW [Clostridiales bacterium]|nr:putative lipid II flippase FtsW [Clostridiales bacterium]
MKQRLGKIDAPLFLIVIALSVFGVIMVFSASYYATITDNLSPYYYLERAGMWAAGGVVVMLVFSLVPTKFYMRIAPLVMGLALLFLLALFTPLGISVNGATRWLGVGSLTFMPGEFAKLAVILFVAWFYTKYAKQAGTLLRGFVPMILLIGVLFLLIYKEPNLSTALIVVLTILVMMFLAGVRLVYLIALIVIGVLGVWLMIQVSGGYHLSRVTGYLNPFSDAQGSFFQTVQGLIALGNGGLTGVGLGDSVAKALWLPEAQNDYIFAIIGEETGFVGCILLLLGFLALIWRCMLISMRAQSRFDMLLGGGVTVLMALQVILNVGVVANLFPPTGVTLPFISYGGNAVLLFMFLMGIMLHISRKDPAKIKTQAEPRRGEDAA